MLDSTEIDMKPLLHRDLLRTVKRDAGQQIVAICLMPRRVRPPFAVLE